MDPDIIRFIVGILVTMGIALGLVWIIAHLYDWPGDGP